MVHYPLLGNEPFHYTAQSIIFITFTITRPKKHPTKHPFSFETLWLLLL